MNNSDLCLNKCGFFGNSSFHGYCSKCWKDLFPDEVEKNVKNTKSEKEQSSERQVDDKGLKKKINNEAFTMGNLPTSPVNNIPVLSVVAEKKAESETPVVKSKPVNRCIECRKKIGIYGFTCKCAGYFCTVHRYPESHSCTFDYKKEGEMKITKENPIIKASKIIKI